MFGKTKAIGNLAQSFAAAQYSLRSDFDATPAQEIPQRLTVVTLELARKVDRVYASRGCKAAQCETAARVFGELLVKLS